mgnify:FL=1
MKIKCHDCTASHETKFIHWLLSKLFKSYPICGHRDHCKGLKELCCNDCVRLTAHFIHPIHWISLRPYREGAGDLFKE